MCTYERVRMNHVVQTSWCRVSPYIHVMLLYINMCAHHVAVYHHLYMCTCTNESSCADVMMPCIIMCTRHIAVSHEHVYRRWDTVFFDTATHCNTLQHTATHCTTPKSTLTRLYLNVCTHVRVPTNHVVYERTMLCTCHDAVYQHVCVSCCYISTSVHATLLHVNICTCVRVQTYQHVYMSCCCTTIWVHAMLLCIKIRIFYFFNPNVSIPWRHPVIRFDFFDTATHCNTLQHTATHCTTLQHTATHCTTLQHTATH